MTPPRQFARCADKLFALPPGVFASRLHFRQHQLRIVCGVCARQLSKYGCPRCNKRTCSLECYKAHSTACTELFAADNVTQAMKGARRRIAPHTSRLFRGSAHLNPLPVQACALTSSSDASSPLSYVAYMMNGLKRTIHQVASHQKRLAKKAKTTTTRSRACSVPLRWSDSRPALRLVFRI